MSFSEQLKAGSPRFLAFGDIKRINHAISFHPFENTIYHKGCIPKYSRFSVNPKNFGGLTVLESTAY